MTSACFSRGHTGFSRNATLVATVNPPALAGGVFNPANLDGRFATPGLHIKGSLRAVLCLVRPLASAVSSFPAGPSRTPDGRQRHALSFSTRTDLRTVPIVPLLSGRMPAPGQPGQKTPPRNGHCHPSRASAPAGPSRLRPGPKP